MLKFLSITNFAVIRSLRIDFNKGLNVLTGETGAGKSIIVDAVSLLLGNRANSDMVRSGERFALVEGIFELDEIVEQRVKIFLSNVGVEFVDTDFLIIRREVQREGRSRIFVNDRSVTISTLKSLQPFLVDIHGQGDQRALLSPRAHLLMLDSFGGCNELRQRIASKYEDRRKVVESIKALTRDKTERERTLEMLRFQIAEIEHLNPQLGEENHLLEEKKLLTHAERLIELNTFAYNELYENEESVLSRLASVRRVLQELETIDRSFSSSSKTIEETTLLLSDVADILRTYGNKIDYSPARLSQIEERLSEFERVKRKYGHGISDLNEIKEQLSQHLSQLTNSEERQGELLEELKDIQRDYQALARSLTACRCAAISVFEARVMEDLRHVAMESARFVVQLETAEEDSMPVTRENLESQSVQEDLNFPSARAQSYWSAMGADRVEFLLSANLGEDVRPLHRVASGGELSRLMLTLRKICHNGVEGADELSAAATLVFDEVDTGIGGRVAEAVGQRLKSLAASQQVLSVTHQPQIARFADHHYAITKYIEDERTVTRIKELNREERVAELSRMLGVSHEVTTARETSEWLLETAQKQERPTEPAGKVSGQTRKKRNSPKSR